MAILIAITSILAITALVWIFNKISPFYICPICAGVSGTWLWMLIGALIGQLPIINYQLPISILMGGSVVGLTYQGEKYLVSIKASANKVLLWKSLFIPAGFATVYGLVTAFWQLFIAALAVVGIVAVGFLLPDSGKNKQENKKISEIEEKMKNCC